MTQETSVVVTVVLNAFSVNFVITHSLIAGKPLIIDQFKMKWLNDGIQLWDRRMADGHRADQDTIDWVLLAVCNLIPYHLNLPVATRVVGQLKGLFSRVCLKMSVCKVAAWQLAGKTDRSHNLSHIPCSLTSQHLAFKKCSGMAELICYYDSNRVELYKQLGKNVMYCFTWPMEFVIPPMRWGKET